MRVLFVCSAKTGKFGVGSHEQKLRDMERAVPEFSSARCLRAYSAYDPTSMSMATFLSTEPHEAPYLDEIRIPPAPRLRQLLSDMRISFPIHQANILLSRVYKDAPRHTEKDSVVAIVSPSPTRLLVVAWTLLCFPRNADMYWSARSPENDKRLDEINIESLSSLVVDSPTFPKTETPAVQFYTI